MEARLRWEQHLRPFKELFEGQQNALTRAGELLQAAAEAAGSIRMNREGRSLDNPPHHFSPVIFIDGVRGSGKSTVLINLIAMTGGFSSVGEEIILKRPKVLETMARERRLIWLRMLDLEPLPKDTNLLSAVLARIDREYGRILSKEIEHGRESSKDWEGRQHRSTGDEWVGASLAAREFSRLRDEAALSWDGNLQERRSQDPDTYAEEVKRIEDARAVAADLDLILQGVALEVQKLQRLSDPPLFVLSIDDIDLNPSRAIELLHLLRMTRSANLAFVVGGSLDNIKQILELRHLSNLGEVVSNVNNIFLDQWKDEIPKIARGSANAALAKLLPLEQRITLDDMLPGKAATFIPPKLEKRESAPTLMSTLQDLPLTTSEEDEYEYRGNVEPFSSLWDLIWAIENVSENLQKSSLWSSLSRSLGGPARSVYQNWHRAQQAVDDVQEASSDSNASPISLRSQKQKKAEATLRYVGQSYRDAVNEDTRLPGWAREAALAACDDDFDLRTKELPPGKVIMTSRNTLGNGLRLTDMYARFSVPSIFTIVFQRDIDVIVASPRTAAWAFLLNDVLATRPGSHFYGPNLSPSVNGWAGSSALDYNHMLDWSCPDFDMAVDAELLRYCWQEVVKHLWNLLRKKIKGCNIQMIAAYYWIDLVTSVMEKGDACIRKKKIPIRFMAKKPSDNDWNRLVDRVINVMPSKPPYLGRLSDAAIWPSWVATMIAPEGGLDRTLAERFLRNGDFKKQIANDREMIKQRRAKRLLGNSNPFVVEPETRLKNLRKIGANLSDWKKWLTDKKAEVHDHPFEKHSSFIEALKYAEGEYLRMHQMLTGSLPQGVTDQQG